MGDFRICSRCLEEKRLAQFYRSVYGVGGRSVICMRCVRRESRALEDRHGLNPAEYETGPYSQKHGDRWFNGAKECTSCNIIKPLDKFYRQGNGKFGRKAECMACTRRRRREYDKTPAGRKTREREKLIRALGRKALEELEG